MRFSEILAASAALGPLVAAHGDHIPGMPKIFGMGAGVKRDFLGPAARRAALPQNKPHVLNKRQGGTDGQCGPSNGGASCADGYCCSSAGWCGNEPDYCNAPDCLIDYGTGCDANRVPNGDDTRNIARPQLGDITYGGEGVYPCAEAGTVAVTYDDGPYIYTGKVLDQFASYNMKATFFVTGINNGKGAIDDASTQWPAIISRMDTDGHQIASHTWSHQDLSVITQAQRIDQMVHNEMAIRNIIQKFPTYMRPPYSSCNAACQTDLAKLGYVITYFNMDTDDYDNTTPDKIQNAKDRFYNAVQPSNVKTDNFLTIMHDIHEQTALNLTGYVLDLIQKKGYKAVTVGECLGDPKANWYRSSSGHTVSSSSSTPSATPTGSTTSSAAPTATPTGVSKDGTCGPAVGLSCIGFSEGSCCSQYGYCGATTDHCGTGCQSLFGTCGSSSSGSSSSSSTTATAPTGTPSGSPTTDGTCGGTKGFSCVGYSEGECCSQYGWCGKTTDHCGTGCNPLFGKCGSSGSSSAAGSSVTSRAVQPSSATRTTITTSATSTTKTTAAPTATSKVSTNGRCGSRNSNMTCAGSKYGSCCRMDGQCGSGILACGLGCQKNYGTGCWF